MKRLCALTIVALFLPGCAYEKTTDILLSGLKKNDRLTEDQQSAAFTNALAYMDTVLKFYDLRIEQAKPEEREAIIVQRNQEVADFYLMMDTEMRHGRMAKSIRGDFAAFCVLHGVNADTLSQFGIVLGEGVDQIGATFTRWDREKKEKQAAEPAKP